MQGLCYYKTYYKPNREGLTVIFAAYAQHSFFDGSYTFLPVKVVMVPIPDFILHLGLIHLGN